MSLISSKSGILTIVNIVVAAIIIGCIADVGTQTKDYKGNKIPAQKGNYNFGMVTSGICLLIMAGASLIFHVISVITSFIGDESSILKMKLFQAKQIVTALIYFGSSVSFLILIEDTMSNAKAAGVTVIPKNINIMRTASSFGIIGALTHGVTAFLSFKGM